MPLFERNGAATMGPRMNLGRQVALTCMAAAACVQPAWATEDSLVHRFLQVELSPDGTFVASVEGDSPVNAPYPIVRELVIRRVATGAQTQIALPCGRVPQCWPGSPTWSSDNEHLSFTLRKPGSHTYSVYTVSPDGSHLSKQIDFE